MQFLSQARQERQGEMSTAGRWTAGAPPVQKDGNGARHRRKAAARPLTAGHQCTPMRIGVTWGVGDRKSKRLNSSHLVISYAVFCLKKKTHVLSLSLYHAC